MSVDSVLESVKASSRIIVDKLKEEYLREPAEQDLWRIVSINAARDFSGCIGSTNCQHWEWKNSSIAWAGQFKEKGKEPTVVLEAIYDGELWIWYAQFGSPGSLNDINVLGTPSTIKTIIEGSFSPYSLYEINGRARNKPYYLADGICLDWALFVKTIWQDSVILNKDK